jgi:predicted dehydrogenase
MNEVAIAVIGAGWWATYNHIPTLEQNGRVARIVAVDNNIKRLSIIQEEFSISAAYKDVDEMLESEEIDGAIIATPHPSHYVHAVKCIEKGIHVLVEKPMTTSAKDARKLVELAELNSTEILVANGWNYTPYMLKARQKILEGSIGNIKHVVAQMASPTADLFEGAPMKGTESHLFRPNSSTWANPKNAGGYSWGQLSHLLAALYYLIDEDPKSAYAKFQLSSSRVDYYDAAVLETKQGTSICLSGASTMPKHKEYMLDIRIFGSKGVLVLDIERERMSIMSHEGEDIDNEMKPGDGDYPEQPPIDYFIDLCSGKAIQNPANGIVGLRSVETLELMHRSAKSGKVEELEFYSKPND